MRVSAHAWPAIGLLLGLLLGLATCSSGSTYHSVLSDAMATRDRDWVAVVRLGCLQPGVCSAYELAVYADGAVHWDGSECVSKKGERRYRIAEQRAAALFERLAAAGISRLAGRYNDDCTAHLGVTTLYWSRGGERTRIQLVHYACDADADIGGYIKAMLMADDIHDVTGTTHWRCETPRRDD